MTKCSVIVLIILMDQSLENHRFYIPYTYPNLDKEAVLADNDSDYRDLVIGNVRPEFKGPLSLKLEEYIWRAQSSVKPDTVLDAICKIAVVDILLREGTVEYNEAFGLAAEGCQLYGTSLFSEILNAEDEEATNYIFDNFCRRAFQTIQLYAVSGNEHIAGGTQLQRS